MVGRSAGNLLNRFKAGYRSEKTATGRLRYGLPTAAPADRSMHCAMRTGYVPLTQNPRYLPDRTGLWKPIGNIPKNLDSA
jgi:hypothetical protein